MAGPARGILALACLIGAAGCGYVEIRRVDASERAAERLGAARDRFRGGDLAGAERELDEALALDPRLIEAHELYQDILRSAGREEWLADRYARMQERDPDDPAFLYLEARALPRGRERQSLLERVLRDRPKFASARLLLAEDLRREGAFASALTLADQEGGEDPRILRLGADLCLDLRRPGDARARAARALERDPREPAGFELAAEIAVSSGDRGAIEALADRAARSLGPSRVRSLLEILRGFPPDDPAALRRMDESLQALCDGERSWSIPRLILAGLRRPHAPAAAAEAIRRGPLEDPSPRLTAMLHGVLIEALDEAGLGEEVAPVLDSGARQIPERWEVALARAERAWLSGDGPRSAAEIARHAATYGARGVDLRPGIAGESFRLPPPDAEALRLYYSLRGLLAGPSSADKVRGLRGLVGSRAAWAAPLLLRALDDPSETVRVVAVRALAGVASDLGRRIGRGLAADPSPRVRAAALAVLARDPDRSSLEAIVSGLEDPDPYVREVAIIGLEKRRGDRFGFDPAGDPGTRAEAVSRWRAWLSERPGP